ncbi:monocarboxylate transporter 13-like [Lineus longissimus]|uniref:monocarboxylate transporter 13-like n=1 Tax=Lineus longissimus TaxID=88925 RepID=UPI002B4FAF09
MGNGDTADDAFEEAVHLNPATKEEASDVEKEPLKTCPATKKASDFPESFPEGGYGWVVVVASFFGSFMFPLCLTYGLFHVVLVEQLGRSRGETALVGSVTYLFTAGAGPLSSFLCNLIGHRGTCILGSVLATSGYLISAFSSSFELLFFSYGCLVGTGISLQLVPTMVLVQFYFEKRRALAVAIVRTGSGVGSLVLPPIVQLLIDEYSWRGAMILLAGFALQGCVIGALLRPNAKSTMSKISNIRDRQSLSLRETIMSNLAHFKDCRFLMCSLVQFSEGVHSVIYYYLLPDRVVGFGFTSDQAAFFLFLTGVSSTITRLATGVLTNHFKLNSIVLHGCAFLLMSTCHLSFSLLSNPSYGVLVTISVVFGLGFGVTTCNLILLMLQLFGIHRMTVALGWVLLAEGIGGFIGPPIGGAIFDMTESYTYSFLLSGGFAFLACVLTIPLFVIHKYKFKQGLQRVTTKCDEFFD